ncbi:MAG: NAD(P)H-binding protein [bacterium]|nr:NAD(P)H-binding protein [bacterium]
MIYVIAGATGNTGSIVAQELLKTDAQVRVIARSADKLAPLATLGAEPFVGELQDTEAMKRAFAGAEAAYVMIPPNFGVSNFRTYQDSVTDSLADALATSGVKHVVSLSSVGANRESGVGPISGLNYLEKQLDGIPDMSTLHLRAGFFMENIFGSLALIKKMGIYGTATAASAPWPLIATHDIGHFAAQRLTALNFNGKNVQYLLGPRDVTGQETAAILAKTFGLAQLPYVQFSLQEMKHGMVDGGVPEHFADLYCELYAGFNNGLLDYHRDAESTTPGRLEVFAMNALKPAFDAM